MCIYESTCICCENIYLIVRNNYHNLSTYTAVILNEAKVNIVSILVKFSLPPPIRKKIQPCRLGNAYRGE